MTEARSVVNLRRETKETTVIISLKLDGRGECQVHTGNPFLDHMVNQLARHGLFDITLGAEAKDLLQHHLVEDVAIMVGRAFHEALGDRKGIRRMGHAIVPLDETLVMVAVDLSGRAYHAVKTGLDGDGVIVETLSGDLIRHFLEAFATEGKMNLHTKVLTGTSPHHKAEALFKALARALRDAVELDPRAPEEIPSTKGTVTG